MNFERTITSIRRVRAESLGDGEEVWALQPAARARITRLAKKLKRDKSESSIQRILQLMFPAPCRRAGNEGPRHPGNTCDGARFPGTMLS